MYLYWINNYLQEFLQGFILIVGNDYDIFINIEKYSYTTISCKL